MTPNGAGNVEQRLLPCKLTNAELLVAAEELAAKLTAKEAEENDQEEVKALMKSRLAGLERDVAKMCDVVRSKTEMRMVETYTRVCPDDMHAIETVRQDTYEVIERRRMTLEERNLTLFPTIVPREAQASVEAPVEEPPPEKPKGKK